jgi:glycosyltransferase involved in cell wall biosynthesis
MPPPHRVLLAHNTYQVAGGEDSAFELDASVLAANGHDVVRFTRDNHEIDSYGTLERVRLAGRTVWNGTVERELAELIERTRPDVAHFHNTFPLISPAAYAACRAAGVPVVQTLHNFRLVCLNALLFRDGHICEDCVGRSPWPGVVHRCYRGSTAGSGVVASMLVVHRALRTWKRKVDLFLTPSEFTKTKLVEGGLPDDRIVVRPHLLEPDPGARPAATAGSYFLFAGRLSPEKGIGTVVRAFETLPDIPLKIAGDGPLRDELERAVRARALGNIEVLGRVSGSGVGDLLRDARAVLVPSVWYEVSPLIFVEGMAAGAPFISSDLPASRELLGENAGLLVPPGDVAEWTRAIRWAWEHPTEMRTTGAAGRKRFEARHTAERGYRTLIDAYELAAANASAGR